MIDYEKEFERSEGYQGQVSRQTLAQRLFAFVYGWMAAGLALSGFIAWWTHETGFAYEIVSGPGMYVCIIAELALVFALSGAIRKLSVAAAILMFIAYAALNGLTMSVIFYVFDLGLIETIFLCTAGMFAGLALWGTFTKCDLTSVGSMCGLALWGLIVAIIVNVFLDSASIDFYISFAGILIFTGLTMYDAQKIRQLAQAGDSVSDTDLRKAGVIGALALYLDFINLFWCLLKLYGRER